MTKKPKLQTLPFNIVKMRQKKKKTYEQVPKVIQEQPRLESEISMIWAWPVKKHRVVK